MITIKNIIYSAVALFAFACFTLSPMAQAQLSPPPDGGYPNANTAEGDGSLFNLTSGVQNTAAGFNALNSNTTGEHNTAVGNNTLVQNNGNNNTAIGDLRSNNTTGNDNTANGVSAIQANTTGSKYNGNNTTGNNNTAIGDGSISSTQPEMRTRPRVLGSVRTHGIGGGNTANGRDPLQQNDWWSKYRYWFSGTAQQYCRQQCRERSFCALRPIQPGPKTLRLVSLRSLTITTGIQNTAMGFRALLLNTTSRTQHRHWFQCPSV